MRSAGYTAPDDAEPAVLEPLAAVFALGASAGREALARSLGADLVESLRAAGVLRGSDDRLEASVRVDTLDELLLLHDAAVRGRVGRDHVAGVGGATRTLASLTVRRPVETALDVGTGCGVQALLAARHARRVVAVDVNPRALRFAGLNARLNGIDNVELVEGSFFDPVEGARFDLVVANPPFVVSPDDAYVFRDAGLPGDEISRRVIRSAAAHLADGAYAAVLASWIHEPDDWAAPLRAWLDGAGVDAWVLRYRSHEPRSYAAAWNDPLRLADPDAFAAAVSRWQRYYEEAGIDAIAVGAVVLRRRSGENWLRPDDPPYAPTGSASEQIQRVFAAPERLAGRDLLGAAFRLVEGHRLEQTLSFRGGAYDVSRTQLVLDAGAGTAVAVPPAVLHVLLRVDGSTPLGDLVAAAAADTGLDPASLGREAADALRRLVEGGLAVPVP